MTIRLQKILLPTDFSNYSAAATKYACELATKFDAELHLLHLLEAHLASAPEFEMGLALPHYLKESRTAAEKALAGVLDGCGADVAIEDSSESRETKETKAYPCERH